MACFALACGPGEDRESGGGSGEASGTGAESSTGPTTTADATDESSSSGAMSPDVPDVACETTAESDLPGVTIDISAPCVLTLAEARDGVETQYVVSIAEALEAVESGTSCYETPPGAVHVEWSVHGGDLRHCHCDVGLCPPPRPMPTTLVVGDTDGGFEWFAYDWDGPSDYDPPFGDAFTPGEYTIEVTASGFWGAEMTPFSVRATRPIVLVE